MNKKLAATLLIENQHSYSMRAACPDNIRDCIRAVADQYYISYVGWALNRLLHE